MLYVEEKVRALGEDLLQAAPKEVCQDVAHLEQYFQTIVEEGGEGIILRDPQAILKPGRSAGYLKHKASNLFLSSRKHASRSY